MLDAYVEDEEEYLRAEGMSSISSAQLPVAVGREVLDSVMIVWWFLEAGLPKIPNELQTSDGSHLPKYRSPIPSPSARPSSPFTSHASPHKPLDPVPRHFSFTASLPRFPSSLRSSLDSLVSAKKDPKSIFCPLLFFGAKPDRHQFHNLCLPQR